MFKPPTYRSLLDPKDMPAGYRIGLLNGWPVTEHDFYVAVVEVCRRAHAAGERWSRFRVRFRPPGTMAPDLKEHRRLWNELEAARALVGDVAMGLLGLLSAPALNAEVQGMLPGLLQASKSARKRARRASRKGAR